MTISISDGTYTVDFTNLGVSVKNTFTNPIITFNVPQQVATTLGSNTICINLGLIQHTFMLTFTLTDGPGTYGGGTFSSPSTNYEKIVYLAAYDNNPKTLTLGGGTFTGHIESFDIEWAEGKKNIAENCTLSFVLTSNIQMH